MYGAIREAVSLGGRIIQQVIDAAPDLEQQLAVDEEIDRVAGAPSSSAATELVRHSTRQRCQLPGSQSWWRRAFAERCRGQITRFWQLPGTA